MKNNTGGKFTTSPYRLWALLSAAIIVTSIVGVAYDRSHGMAWQMALTDRAYAAGIAILVSFWLSWAVSLLSPIRLSHSGIRSFTLTGTYRLIPWEDIQSIDSVALPGFRYARVVPNQGKTIWIPAWLVNREDFIAATKKQGLVGIAFERAFDGSVKHNCVSDAAIKEHSMQESVYHPAR
jgi:hypothetical protein